MKITDLRLTLDQFTLQIDDMRLEPGRVYGLIGPNGCGKTTLMGAAAGLRHAWSGSIDTEGLTPREITLVPRRSYMLHGTVYKNLVYPLKLRGLPVDETEISGCLETLKLERNQYTPGLSGGQRQKLALMRAMLFKPRLIFLDEAFSNMDMESTELFESLIADYQRRESAAWLIAGHQLAGIRKLCEHVFFMQGGRILESGTDILSNPQSEPLKRYLRREVS